jgi:hypothetical protein
MAFRLAFLMVNLLVQPTVLTDAGALLLILNVANFAESGLAG